MEKTNAALPIAISCGNLADRANWLGETLDPQNQSTLKVCEGLGDDNVLSSSLTTEQRALQSIPLLMMLSFWENLISRGIFSSLYMISPVAIGTDWVWDSFIPYRINMFMWRLFQHALPSDEKRDSVGV